MKIIETTRDDIYEGRGYGSSRLSIALKTYTYDDSISFGGGEPEDNCLARDLSGAYQVKDMLVAAWNAGRNGEILEIVEITEDEEEQEDEE